MATAARQRQTGSEILYSIVMAAFFGMIWFGYRTSISTSFPRLNQLGVGILALLGVAVVYVCVRTTGWEWSEWHRAGFVRRAGIVAMFLPLFLFSAFGIIAGAMLLYEGPIICRDAMVKLNTAFSQLEASARTQLSVPAIDVLEKNVAAARKTLSDEIRNPEGGKYCGVGQRANETLTELENLLPTFRRLRAPAKPQHDCSKTEELDALVNEYQGLIDSALANDPLYTQTRYREKVSFGSELKAAADEQIGELQTGITQLSAVTTFAFNLNLYRDSVATLETANSIYTKYYQGLAGLVGASNISAPETVDIAPAENIASFFQIFNSLYYRSDKSSTWIYIIGAILCDITAASIACWAILRVRKIDLYRAAYVDDRRVGNTDVKYIWRTIS
jgi:hypothetical protein